MSNLFQIKNENGHSTNGETSKFSNNTSQSILKTGVDYAGPVILKSKLGRNPVLTKAWIAVFVCLATRAVHLELVSDATSNAFIAALKRLIARRGQIQEMISDNGRNFVGANNYLTELFKIQNEHSDNYAREFNLKWRFNPPGAPHHGGIFEAAVKSMKHHLIRVIGTQTLTFEEYATILCQVEACLNSRPIAALNDDATNALVLTPAHFLLGKPLVALPEVEDLTQVPENRLNRWQLTQQMIQHFWKRWKDEYVLTLIQRNKWNGQTRNIQVGDIVIVQNEVIEPLKWWTSIVTRTFPGKDQLVRTVEIKHLTNLYIRPITKLAVLIPVESYRGENRATEVL